jgi:hypothetical protein
MPGASLYTPLYAPLGWSGALDCEGCVDRPDCSVRGKPVSFGLRAPVCCAKAVPTVSTPPRASAARLMVIFMIMALSFAVCHLSFSPRLG